VPIEEEEEEEEEDEEEEEEEECEKIAYWKGGGVSRAGREVMLSASLRKWTACQMQFLLQYAPCHKQEKCIREYSGAEPWYRVETINR
jgi:hypothetical protein